MGSSNHDFDVAVKLRIYETVAATTRMPTAGDVAAVIGRPAAEVEAAFGRLQQKRLLVLEPGAPDRIRMAPPFSGVTTQHRVDVAGTSYFANCAWDALGIPAALHQAALVHSRCEQSGEPLRLEIGLDGPVVPERRPGRDSRAASDWLFHCTVPAAHWWRDIVFT